MTKIDKEKIVQRNVLCVPQTCRGICHRRGSKDAKGLSDLRKQGGFQEIGSKNPLQNRCESHVVCDVCAYPHEQKTIFHATKIFRTNPIEICVVCEVPGWLCLLSELFHMEKSQPTNWDGSEPAMMSHSMRYTHRYYTHMPMMHIIIMPGRRTVEDFEVVEFFFLHQTFVGICFGTSNQISLWFRQPPNE